MNTTDIARFYDYSERFRVTPFQNNLGSYAIHYGLWDETVRSRDEAMLNTNKELAKIASIKTGDYILDAGCGVGGSSVWLAQQYKTSVVGITLSQKETSRATELAERFHTHGLASFETMNFTKTNFPDKSFDVIWAIESVIYSLSKRAFLKEAFRLLRKRGRLIIADAYLDRQPENIHEEKALNTFKEGFAVLNIASADSFEAEMQTQGFNNTHSWDRTAQILPSVRQTHLLCLLSFPATWLSQVFRVTPKMVTKNVMAGIAQKKLFESGLLKYKIFFGQID